MNTGPTQAETIAALALRCDGPDQAERFDRAVRIAERIEEAILKEEARLKRLLARRRTKKPA